MVHYFTLLFTVGDGEKESCEDDDDGTENSSCSQEGMIKHPADADSIASIVFQKSLRTFRNV